ncbi:hypothetical protein ACHAXR_012069 [Thalassiosira sp. AJA248-18]
MMLGGTMKPAVTPTVENDAPAPAGRLQRLSDGVTEAAKAARKVNKVSSNLTQLNLANMHLHGRDDDMQLLKNKLRAFAKVDSKDDDAIDDDATRRLELVLVAGVSGTGKSALVKRGLEEPAQKKGLAFVGGKFDLNNAGLPLSAFSSAMTSLTQFIMANKNKDKIKEGIKEAMSDKKDIIHLLGIMPGCEDLFTFEGSNLQLGAKNAHHPSIGGKEAVQQLQYSIRRLLKIICSNLKGVVLFIDDLQWSDVGTIELLKSIITDKDIPSLIVVGAYREDEVSDSHPLMLQIKDCEANGVETTTLKIGNLSLSHAKSMVAEALRMEDNEEAVSALATTIYKKTNGNAFFVLVFLRSLYDEELLQYNFGAMKWIWDDDAVNSKLVTENVATILINKLKRFDKPTQMALQVASCLGASFSMSIVALVIGGLSTSETYASTTSLPSSMIEELEDDGLWEEERDSPGRRRFSHDQIQSAAFELIPSETRDSFRGQIGDILMQKLAPEDLEGHLFEVVSLRNCDKASTAGQDRQELASMNLRAGLKASGNAAFDAAVVYYRTGRELLGATAWDDDRATMLQLCSQEANACFLLIDEVLSKDIAIEDKYKAYEIKMLAAQAESNFLESVDIGIEVRKQLGLRTPANKPASMLVILKEFFKTSRLLGKRTPEELASLPKLEDEKIIMGQRMLELLNTASYIAQPTLMPLINFLMLRASIKHGINATSCDAFSGYGVLLIAAFGKFDRARDMARATELLLENPDYGRKLATAAFGCESFIYHWTAPLQGTLTPLLTGFQKGLEIGDIESARVYVCNRSLSSYHCFLTPKILIFYGIQSRRYSSRPLDGVVHELQTNVDVIGKQLKLQTYVTAALVFLVAAKELRGIDNDDIGFEEILTIASESNDVLCRAFTITTQIETCVIFHDMDTALNLLNGAGNVRADTPGMYVSVRFTVLEALVYLKAAQASTSWQVKRKLTKKATKSMKLIRGWLKGGNVNVVHAMHLISAELAVLKGNKSEAEEQFKSAISVASRNGFLQDRGLAHELAGRHYATQGDTYWVRFHLERAEQSFTDWGATAKVEQLRETKRVLLGDD